MRRTAAGWGMLLPGVAALLGLVLIPLLIMVVYSLAERVGAGNARPFTGHYTRLADPLYLRIFLRSVAQAGLATGLCLVLSYPLALYVARSPAHRRGALLFLVTIPFWTNFLVRTYALMVLLRAQGVINTVLAALGIIEQPLPLLYNEAATQLGLVYTLLPMMVLPLYSNLEKLDGRLLEAAGDLGATPAAAFWQVTWPLSRPGVAVGSVMVFISAFGMYLVPDLMGGGNHIMVGNLIQNQFMQARNWPFGAAAALALAGVVFLAALLVQRKSLLSEGGRR